MADKPPITKEGFETLLRWFDPDRETAGQKYLDLRLRLVRMFVGRGCPAAEELSDETIDRVIKKTLDIVPNYRGDPMPYFYAVAQNVFHEWTRKPKHQELPQVLPANEPATGKGRLEMKQDCLKECLEKLVPAQRELIVNYYDYKGSKRDKINRRKAINTDLGITPELMRIRIYRIRTTLRKCIQGCVEKSLAKLSGDFII